MNASNILDRLSALGVSIAVSNDRLKLVPGSRVPPDLVDALRLHKAEIVARLSRRPTEPAVPETSTLLAWASELAEQDLVLPTAVSFVEAPLRTVTSSRVSWCAAHYLKTIVVARHHQEHPHLCCGLWTPLWWGDREQEALGALAALHEALEKQNRAGEAGNE